MDDSNSNPQRALMGNMPAWQKGLIRVGILTLTCAGTYAVLVGQFAMPHAMTIDTLLCPLAALGVLSIWEGRK